MKVLPLVDMRMTPSEAADCYPCPTDAPAYPYGLCISLCQDELEKLGISFDDLCVGDLVHLHALAMITSKSSSERQDSEPSERVEIQITHMAGESEDEEDTVEEKAMSGAKKMSKLYKSKV
jgi:hypothetical protein